MVPTAAELRERADALRDEADALAAALASLDIRIDNARLAAGVGPRAAPASPAGLAAGPRLSPELAQLHVLSMERAAVANRLSAVRGEAAALDAAARTAALEEAVGGPAPDGEAGDRPRR